MAPQTPVLTTEGVEDLRLRSRRAVVVIIPAGRQCTRSGNSTGCMLARACSSGNSHSPRVGCGRKTMDVSGRPWRPGSESTAAATGVHGGRTRVGFEALNEPFYVVSAI